MTGVRSPALSHGRGQCVSIARQQHRNTSSVGAEERKSATALLRVAELQRALTEVYPLQLMRFWMRFSQWLVHWADGSRRFDHSTRTNAAMGWRRHDTPATRRNDAGGQPSPAQPSPGRAVHSFIASVGGPCLALLLIARWSASERSAGIPFELPFRSLARHWWPRRRWCGHDTVGGPQPGEHCQHSAVVVAVGVDS